MIPGESTMDRVACRAIVYEVAKSWTQLSIYTHTHTHTEFLKEIESYLIPEPRNIKLV